MNLPRLEALARAVDQRAADGLQGTEEAEERCTSVAAPVPTGLLDRATGRCGGSYCRLYPLITARVHASPQRAASLENTLVQLVLTEAPLLKTGAALALTPESF